LELDAEIETIFIGIFAVLFVQSALCIHRKTYPPLYGTAEKVKLKNKKKKKRKETY